MNERCSWEVQLRRSLLPLRSSNWNKFNSVKSAFIFILLPLCVHPPPLEQKVPLWQPWTQSKDHTSAAACRMLLILPPCASFTAYLFLCSPAKSIKLNRSCSSRFSLSLLLDKKTSFEIKEVARMVVRLVVVIHPYSSPTPTPSSLTGALTLHSAAHAHVWRLCQSHRGGDSQASAPLWTFRILLYAQSCKYSSTQTHTHTQSDTLLRFTTNDTFFSSGLLTTQHHLLSLHFMLTICCHKQLQRDEFVFFINWTDRTSCYSR